MFGLISRSVQKKKLAFRDIYLGSYLKTSRGLRLVNSGSLEFSALDIEPDVIKYLQAACPRYLCHEFDLLGSGWTKVVHGVAAKGIEGKHFASEPIVSSDTRGNWLEGRLNRSNLKNAQRIWAHINCPAYQPIDWNVDFKSGYRWSEERHSASISIPVNEGADIKVPWELSRLQHLPQLAICAILAKKGVEGFDDPAKIETEIENQILDFIALNPPRFGPNWVCPMDVGIRISNILMSLDILSSNDVHMNEAFLNLVAHSTKEHVLHILKHLEWSETGRSNHYLADVVGLLWGASYLNQCEEHDAIIAFSIRELLNEADVQYLEDGGNYEGSSSYHRLSTELLAFGLARILGLENSRSELFQTYDRTKVSVRPPFKEAPIDSHDWEGDSHYVPLEIFAKVQKAGDLCQHLTAGNEVAVQIGDTDSGRLFKLGPKFMPDVEIENSLDFTSTAEAVRKIANNALAADRSLDALFIGKLLRGNHLAGLNVSPKAGCFGCLNEVKKSFDEVVGRARVVTRYEIPTGSTKNIQRHAFFDFGLYVFKSERFHLSFRCLTGLNPAAPTGHTHDDNLSVQLSIDDQYLLRDPGTFLYTASSAQRNLYRHATAHNGPRVKGDAITKINPAHLFELKHRFFAKCLLWHENAIAAEIDLGDKQVKRLVEISDTDVVITDALIGEGILEVTSEFDGNCIGYGRKENSIHTV